MRIDGVMVNSENDALLSEVATDEILDQILKLWKNDEYGTPLDFGGGVRDVTCAQLVEACDGNPTKLHKMFPFLTKPMAEQLLRNAKTQAKYDV